MTVQFFLPMVPPTITQQEHRLGVSRKGSAYVYDPPELKEARQKFTAHLSRARQLFGPVEPFQGGVRLTTWWCFPIQGDAHQNGEYKLTRPDTDNSLKLFKDCMTAAGFWQDDALVASEVTEKYWADHPGIFVKVEEL